MNPYSPEPIEQQNKDLIELKNAIYLMMICQCVYFSLQLVATVFAIGVASKFIKINL